MSTNHTKTPIHLAVLLTVPLGFINEIAAEVRSYRSKFG